MNDYNKLRNKLRKTIGNSLLLNEEESCAAIKAFNDSNAEVLPGGIPRIRAERDEDRPTVWHFIAVNERGEAIDLAPLRWKQ